MKVRSLTQNQKQNLDYKSASTRASTIVHHPKKKNRLKKLANEAQLLSDSRKTRHNPKLQVLQLNP
jgi:hypothetical protein